MIAQNGADQAAFDSRKFAIGDCAGGDFAAPRRQKKRAGLNGPFLD
jgi:hypothetical protein